MRAFLKAVVGAVVAMVGFGLAEQSVAFPLASANRNLTEKHFAFISEKAQTVGPFAHVIFCAKNPSECRVAKRTRWGRAPVFLTKLKQKELRAVNKAVNQTITPRNDVQVNGFGDTWTLAPKAGDCDDYAITKRHMLISMGWPARAVRLAVTYTSSGEGHMVLVVRTSKGDLVLDNRVNAIRQWNKTGLKWMMMQASLDPRKWVGV